MTECSVCLDSIEYIPSNFIHDQHAVCAECREKIAPINGWICCPLCRKQITWTGVFTRHDEIDHPGIGWPLMEPDEEVDVDYLMQLLCRYNGTLHNEALAMQIKNTMHMDSAIGGTINGTMTELKVKLMDLTANLRLYENGSMMQENLFGDIATIINSIGILSRT